MRSISPCGQPQRRLGALATKIGDFSGLTQACAPALRHRYGVAAITAGAPLPTIAAVLGPTSLTTTAIYGTAIVAEVRELVSRVWV